ncbi:unnamed protein product [Linum trigynum]|uniref:Uncharacterized protein n=1 Tax=Linum trigynum TaxID=586398 RepID=A0AAV2DXS0_9ROSI
MAEVEAKRVGGIHLSNPRTATLGRASSRVWSHQASGLKRWEEGWSVSRMLRRLSPEREEATGRVASPELEKNESWAMVGGGTMKKTTTSTSQVRAAVTERREEEAVTTPRVEGLLSVAPVMEDATMEEKKQKGSGDVSATAYPRSHNLAVEVDGPSYGLGCRNCWTEKFGTSCVDQTIGPELGKMDRSCELARKEIAWFAQSERAEEKVAYGP